MTTQNCGECGTRAEPGQSFCDACGAVLSWTDSTPARAVARSGEEPRTSGTTGTETTVAGADGASGAATGTTGEEAARTPAATDSTAPDRTDPDPAAPTTADGHGPAAPTVLGGTAGDGTDVPPAVEDTDASPHRSPGSAAASDGPRPDLAPDETAPTQPMPAAAPGDTISDRVRSLLVPVADPEGRPAAPSIAPVLPGRPVAERPQVRAPGPQQGDENGRPCPWCATPNRPDRHFCSRCAMPMARDDRSPERHPWWRRLLDFRNRETPWAGERPRLRRTFDRIVTWVVAAVVLTLLVTAGANTPAAVQATRDHFAKRVPVAPDEVRASRSYPGHQPRLAFDKVNNTWWGPGVSQSGEGEWIEARFDEPARLLDLVITPGVSTHADQLSQSALPHRIEATITTKNGTTTTRELTLDQGAGGQRRAFRVGDVTKVRFTIESAYAASASKQVAVAEIEFFGPSSASAS
ncbi:NADase-type glycan-binding domain-containing protein [Streptomyces sp. CA-106131]|uniref:NADase-type glycan-binding domain-containing protein n=1 Tax=Streptomyces sp. CA-106131 TaxID=3240045 RepID=UPI003D8D6F3B